MQKWGERVSAQRPVAPSRVNVFLSEDGTWSAVVDGWVSSGFPSREHALEWVITQLLWKLQAAEEWLVKQERR